MVRRPGGFLNAGRRDGVHVQLIRVVAERVQMVVLLPFHLIDINLGEQHAAVMRDGRGPVEVPKANLAERPEFPKGPRRDTRNVTVDSMMRRCPWYIRLSSRALYCFLDVLVESRLARLLRISLTWHPTRGRCPSL